MRSEHDARSCARDPRTNVERGCEAALSASKATAHGGETRNFKDHQCRANFKHECSIIFATVSALIKSDKSSEVGRKDAPFESKSNARPFERPRDESPIRHGGRDIDSLRLDDESECRKTVRKDPTRTEMS